MACSDRAQVKAVIEINRISIIPTLRQSNNRTTNHVDFRSDNVCAYDVIAEPAAVTVISSTSWMQLQCCCASGKEFRAIEALYNTTTQLVIRVAQKCEYIALSMLHRSILPLDEAVIVIVAGRTSCWADGNAMESS